MDQIIVVKKMKGMTSRDVVNIASKKLRTKKIGHTGTLDPLAEGVLVLLTGKYTKLNELLVATEKEYIATVQMGVLTDTLDVEGNILKQDGKIASKEQLEELFANFPKTYLQEVPIYSAVKVKGKKLYEYARNHQEVELPKKEVHLYHLELLEVGKDSFTFRTTVSKGTYIRSLIRDMGEMIGCLFTMKELLRTRQGKFTLEDAISLEEIGTSKQKEISLQEVFDFPTEIVDEERIFAIRNGRKLSNPSGYDRVLFFSKEGEALAIYKKEGSLLRVDKML